MNIFSRFIDIVNANINAMLDKAEDPEKMLRLMIQEMEDTTIELRSACAADMAALEAASRKRKSLAEEEKRWEERARLAVGKGKDDLAREALMEKRGIAAEIRELISRTEDLENDIRREKEEIEALEAKLSDSKSKLRALIEKNEKLRADRREKEEARRERERRFEEMERKIDRAGSRTPQRPDPFQDDEIEKELEALKREKAE